MTLSPISAIGGDYTSVARNYSVSNESQPSDVYRARMAQGVGRTDQVELASPVQYPNADIRAKQAERAQSSIGAEQSFNSVAQRFQGAVTGYGMDGSASSYGMTGSAINFMA